MKAKVCSGSIHVIVQNVGFAPEIAAADWHTHERVTYLMSHHHRTRKTTFLVSRGNENVARLCLIIEQPQLSQNPLYTGTRQAPASAEPTVGVPRTQKLVMVLSTGNTEL